MELTRLDLPPVPPRYARPVAPPLVVAALAALARGNEAVDIHLRDGRVIGGVIDLHWDNDVVYLAAGRRRWTHSVAGDALCGVTNVARGGWRDGAGWRGAFGLDRAVA